MSEPPRVRVSKEASESSSKRVPNIKSEPIPKACTDDSERVEEMESTEKAGASRSH